MKVEIIVICDSADFYGGRLCMLGAFDTLNADNFPASHSSCVVVCKVRADESDHGEQKVEIHIIDPDGHDVIPHSEFSLHADSESPTMCHEHLWRIQGFPLPRPGTFYIDALADGSLLARIPLYVRRK